MTVLREFLCLVCGERHEMACAEAEGDAVQPLIRCPNRHRLPHHPRCGQLAVPDLYTECSDCGRELYWCGCRYRCRACERPHKTEGKAVNHNPFRPNEDLLAALKPGGKITYKYGDFVSTQTITGIKHQSAEPEMWPRLSLLQRVIRRLTPRRWRKPLQPIRRYQPPTISLTTEPTIQTLLREITDGLSESTEGEQK